MFIQAQFFFVKLEINCGKPIYKEDSNIDSGIL